MDAATLHRTRCLSTTRAAVFVFALMIGMSLRADSPENLFRTLGGASLGSIDLRPVKITSVAVDSWDSTPQGTKYFVRLLLNGNLTLHGPAGSPPWLTGTFDGALTGYVLMDRANPSQILQIDLKKDGLNLLVKPTGALGYAPLGNTATTAASFRIKPKSDVTLGQNVGAGVLALSSVQSDPYVLAQPFGNHVPPTRTRAEAHLLADFDLSSALLSWRPANFRVQSGVVPIVLDAAPLRVDAANAKYDRGSIRATGTSLDIILEGVGFDAPTVTLINGDPLPVDAVARVAVGRLTSTHAVGAPASFALAPATKFELLPDRDRVVDLFNDYQRVPERYVPTGNSTAPLISAYALRKYQTALQDAALVPARHEILVTINQSRAIADVGHTVTQADADTAEMICTTFVWAGSLVVDAGEIMILAKSLAPLGLAAGLTVGALTVPTLAAPVFAVVVGGGALVGWAGLRYWGEILEEFGGPGIADGYKPRKVIQSVVEKVLDKGCQVVMKRITTQSKVPTKAADIAVLPPRQPGESDADTTAKWQTSLHTASARWKTMPESEKQRMRDQIACCDRRDFQRGYAQNAQIWSSHASERASGMQELFARQEETRLNNWTAQQRANLSESNNLQMGYNELRAQAEASLRQSIGGYNLTLNYSPSSGWSVSGMGTFGGVSGGSSGTFSCECCTLNCMSLEIKKP